VPARTEPVELEALVADHHDAVHPARDLVARPVATRERARLACGVPLELEAERLGTTHADAGAYLLALWGLPLEIVEAVRCHHRPEDAPGEIVVAVHAADALVREHESGHGGWLHEAFLAASPFADDLPGWRALAARSHPH
jgi:hypothetical protein